MKKQKVNLLKLNKKSISNLTVHTISGGSDTLINFNCRLTNDSFCDCGTNNDCTDTECHTVWDCDM